MAELVVFSLAALALIVAVGLHAYDRIAANALGARKRVLVQTHSGRAFTGVQWKRRGRLLVLKNAELLEPGNAPTTMDGDVILDRGEIEYVQVAG